VPDGLKRYYGGNQLNFITCSCYQRRPLLDDAQRKDEFLAILEELCMSYEFVVVGYVLMPEHFHLLMGEPNRGNPSAVMFALKQRTSRRWLKEIRERHIVVPPVRQKDGEQMGHPKQMGHPDGAPTQFWQRRFYDFNVFSEKKRVEKLKYIHRNPVTRGLVSKAEDWQWSSYRHYAFGEASVVGVGIPVLAKQFKVMAAE
jgi:putative transposase